MKFSQQVLDHFQQPRNVGEFGATEIINIGKARIGTLASGEVIQLQIKVINDKIEETRIKVYGGVATIAAASWISEWLKGKSIEQALTINYQQIVAALELSSLKVHCAVIAEDVVKMAAKDFLENK